MSSVLPAGTCGLHGWHGFTVCPRCSTYAGPYQPITTSEPAPSSRPGSRKHAGTVRTALSGYSGLPPKWPQRGEALAALDALLAEVERLEGERDRAYEALAFVAEGAVTAEALAEYRKKLLVQWHGRYGGYGRLKRDTQRTLADGGQENPEP